MRSRRTETLKKPTAKPRKKPEMVAILPETKVPAIEQLATELDIEKVAEFGLFLKWSVLPSVLRGKPTEYLREVGIIDTETTELLALTTQSAFAEKYKVRDATLTAWKQKIDATGLISEAKSFFKSLTPNVYASFYHATLKHADAPRVRLWEEIFNDKPMENTPPSGNIIQQTKIQQVIINLGKRYEEDLRKAYEGIIREDVSGAQ